MRLLLIITLLLVSCVTKAQRHPVIDSGNYYSYYQDDFGKLAGSKLGTDWMSEELATKIIHEELQKAGYKWIFDNLLYVLAEGQHVLLINYCPKENFGFVYVSGHAGDVTKADRYVNYDPGENGEEYGQLYYTYTGEMQYNPIKKLPANIFRIQENTYWYQVSNSQADRAKIVSREDMIYILRQDVRKYLATLAPKPK